MEYTEQLSSSTLPKRTLYIFVTRRQQIPVSAEKLTQWGSFFIAGGQSPALPKASELQSSLQSQGSEPQMIGSYLKVTFLTHKWHSEVPPRLGNQQLEPAWGYAEHQARQMQIRSCLSFQWLVWEEAIGLQSRATERRKSLPFTLKEWQEIKVRWTPQCCQIVSYYFCK